MRLKLTVACGKILCNFMRPDAERAARVTDSREV